MPAIGESDYLGDAVGRNVICSRRTFQVMRPGPDMRVLAFQSRIPFRTLPDYSLRS